MLGISKRPDVCQVVLASSQTFAAFSGSAPAVSLVYPVRCLPAATGRFKDPKDHP